MKRLKLYLLFGVLFTSSALHAQDSTLKVKVHVTDQETGDDLIGATVMIVRNDVLLASAVTDPFGMAVLSISSTHLETAIVRVSYVGFEPRDLPAALTMDIKMKAAEVILISCPPIPDPIYIRPIIHMRRPQFGWNEYGTVTIPGAYLQKRTIPW